MHAVLEPNLLLNQRNGDNYMKWLKRIIGCIGIALTETFFVGGAISFISTLWWDTEPSLLLLLWIFVITTVFLIACLSLYCANVSLWDSVYEAHETKNNSILCMLPNIKVVVELIDYISCAGND